MSMTPGESTKIVTPQFAQEMWECPQGRLFVDTKKMCLGDGCPLWRWAPLTVDDGPFKAALKKLVAGGMKNDRAARELVDNRGKYGLPEKPYRGWCGLAEKPEA